MKSSSVSTELYSPPVLDASLSSVWAIVWSFKEQSGSIIYGKLVAVNSTERIAALAFYSISLPEKVMIGCIVTIELAGGHQKPCAGWYASGGRLWLEVLMTQQ